MWCIHTVVLTQTRGYCFIFIGLYFQMSDNLSIAVHTFASHILTSLSVDETLLPKYLNLSTNFRGPPLRLEMAPFRLKHELLFVCVHVEANAYCYLLQVMQQGFGLVRHIRQKRIVCIFYKFCSFLSFRVKSFSSLDLSTFEVCSLGRL